MLMLPAVKVILWFTLYGPVDESDLEISSSAWRNADETTEWRLSRVYFQINLQIWRGPLSKTHPLPCFIASGVLEPPGTRVLCPQGHCAPDVITCGHFTVTNLSVCRIDDASSNLTGCAYSLLLTTANLLRLSEAIGYKGMLRRRCILARCRVFRNIFTFGCMQF